MLNSFIIFLFCHFSVWGLLPLFRPNAQLDSVEAILWGFNGGWGFDKHPPLSGWLADWVYQIFPLDFSIYLLSQIAIVFGFVFIWKLAGKILNDSKKQFWAVLLLEGALAYTFFSPEFNVNILLLGLVSAMFYFFYRAVFDKSLYSAILFGVFCALAMLTKYIAGVFLVACLLYLIFTKRGRSFLFSLHAVIAGGVFLSLFIPHVLWMIETDFMTITYAIGRSTKQVYSVLSHVKYPLLFLVAQVGFLIGLLVTFLLMRPSYKKLSDDKGEFLRWIVIAPLVLTLLPAIVFGMKLRSMWGVPLFGFLPLLLLSHSDIKSTRLAKWFLGGFAILTVLAFVGITFLHISKRTHFTGRQLSQDIYDVWQSETESSLDFVGGDMWLAGNVALYHIDNTVRPKVFIEMNGAKNPNLNLEDFNKKGGVILAFSLDEMNVYLEKFPHAKIFPPRVYTLKNAMAKTKKQTVYVLLVFPETKK